LKTPKLIKNYSDIFKEIPRLVRTRNYINHSLVKLKSIPRKVDNSNNWIRFPFYHYVYLDQRKNFSNQLDYMKKYGDFISLDTAVEMINSGEKIDGRYFCVTFDDGMDSCLDIAVPILNERNISAAFFIMTEYTSNVANKDGRIEAFIPGLKYKARYLSWSDCREMLNAGMIIGSHTRRHEKLINLSDGEVYDELKISKEIIENNLNIVCNHFAAPWGRPGIDYTQGRDDIIAAKVGYKSFLAVNRGPMTQGSSPYFINRDFFNAHDDISRLRYYFGE